MNEVQTAWNKKASVHNKSPDKSGSNLYRLTSSNHNSNKYYIGGGVLHKTNVGGGGAQTERTSLERKPSKNSR